jgi:hypothetical protein
LNCHSEEVAAATDEESRSALKARGARSFAAAQDGRIGMFSPTCQKVPNAAQASKEISNMKVHPQISMKTKGREKPRVRNVSKNAGGHCVRSHGRAGRVMILTSSFSLLALVF